MKTLLLFSALMATGISLHAADPAKPKLVPRPVPGLDMPQLLIEAAKETDETEAMAEKPAPLPAVMTINPDQARVIYIHRRATLPPELTKDLPKTEAKPAPTVSTQHLQVKQGEIKIIPKSEVANLLNPKS